MEQPIVQSEAIMQSLRRDILESGVYRDPLPFPDDAIKDEAADLAALLERLSAETKVPDAGDLSGNALKRFLKKVVRKCTRFYVAPAAEDATRFHEDVTEVLQMLNARIKALEEEVARK